MGSQVHVYASAKKTWDSRCYLETTSIRQTSFRQMQQLQTEKKKDCVIPPEVQSLWGFNTLSDFHSLCFYLRYF